jgi:dienelactone hydrolase
MNSFVLALATTFFTTTAFAQAPFDYNSKIEVQSVARDRKLLHKLPILGCAVDVVKIQAEDPATHAPGSLQIRVYTPKHYEHSLIIVPPTGGENPIDRGYADLFCKNNIRAAIVEHWTGDDDAGTDLDVHDRGTARGIVAVKHTVEYLNPEANEPLGILGTSLGAIIASAAVGYEPRITAMALIVGGGGIANINAYSTEDVLIKLREDRMKTYGFKTPEEYEAALNQHIKLDPLYSAKLSHIEHNYMMIGDKDLTVPTKNQIELLDAIGPDKVEQHHFAGNHFETILYTFATHKQNLVDFFTDSLDSDQTK